MIMNVQMSMELEHAPVVFLMCSEHINNILASRHLTPEPVVSVSHPNIRKQKEHINC